MNILHLSNIFQLFENFLYPKMMKLHVNKKYIHVARAIYEDKSRKLLQIWAESNRYTGSNA